DVSGANDDDAVRQVLELEAFIRADQVLLARQIRNHRVGASRDEDGLGGHRSIARSEMDRLVIFQCGAGYEAVNAGLLEDSGIDSVQPVDLAPDIADQGSQSNFKSLQVQPNALASANSRPYLLP